MAASVSRTVLLDKYRTFSQNRYFKYICLDFVNQRSRRTYCVLSIPRMNPIKCQPATTSLIFRHTQSLRQVASFFPIRTISISHKNTPVLFGRHKFVDQSYSLLPNLCEEHRFFCSSSDDKSTKIKRIITVVPSPFKLIRNALFFMLLRAYFDPEITQEDFKEGAKKALVHVSHEISEGNFDNLHGLLNEQTLGEVKEGYSKLSVAARQSLAVNETDVLYSFPHQIGIVYDDKGSKWVHILMRFWCHSMSAKSDMPSEIKSIRLGPVPDDYMKQLGTVVKCTYEFKRDFSPDVEPEWIISYIQHGSLL